ncbi:hypothetical protein [Hymenobacter convexus]|uniref:hypothetical protein n=1 Tax=Hymenobacter sp. CA1UV-4 TaxID=3063782 RepID=UPI0027122BA3|nr:hypothetical protein [Hymenobacter sp. CA1UV-4]MDO7853536.1 hypothetical protein [Hymenobacter sp. CA1UV-4]
MAALLPDFEYDIFISYRHNDEEWMADFITRLQHELLTVFGKELHIYYDRDTRDGLGDTHLVRESLDHRVLKSMILMPVISATYCDTEKYSWRYEFLPFLERAKTDRLGLNLKLAGGGVSSRILPLRIHNLEDKDSQLLEHTLGGFLRSIDFVYEAQGVNRPLRAKDEDLKPATSNGLIYCNQLNKVANTIKDLVEAATSKPLPAPAIPAPVFSTLAAPLTSAPAATGPVVFLAWTTSTKLKSRREELALMCTKAGLRVVPTTDCPMDEEEFRRRTQEGLAAADCSLHLLGNDFGRRFDDDETNSLPKYAYEEARRQAAGRPAFRQLVWFSPDATLDVNGEQQAFVNKIRNEQTTQYMFSSAANAPQVVADLRSTLVQTAPPAAAVEKETDICFVCNSLDLDEANAITDQLGEAFTLDMLTIEPDTAEVYKDKAVRAIPKSKLAVVYFKYSADWALPFVKQVWQLVGGAASPTPILFMGEDDPEQNSLRNFKAPKVISRIQAHQTVSEEVQRVFQKFNSPA